MSRILHLASRLSSNEKNNFGCLSYLIWACLLITSQVNAYAWLSPAKKEPSNQSVLATVLQKDGTLRPGVTGAFNAHAYTLATAPDGQPIFRPTSILGVGDGPWQNGNVNGIVQAVAVASNGDVYVGGRFGQVGSVYADNVAKWNGTTWSILGTSSANGTDDTVFSLALASNGDLYAGGVFRNAGGVAANNIAKWNGTSWSSLGSGANNGTTAGSNTGSTTSSSVVRALAVVSTGELYVGGDFTLAGSTAANNVAKWDGTTWSSLGTGSTNGVTSNQRTVPATVYALAAAGTTVYLCGAFTQAGGTTTSGVVKWSGTAFNALGSAFSIYDSMFALAVASNGDLYAGGQFTQAGGVTTKGVARWNGTTWSSVGGGINNYVYTLAITNSGDLYAGGLFTTAGTTTVSNIAKWNGTTWSTFGTGLNDRVYALGLRTGTNGQLLAGGNFTNVGDGSKPLLHFATYTDATLATTAASTTAALLEVYPIPAHAAVQVTLPAVPGVTQATLQVRDALGRIVLTRVAALPATGLSQELSIQGLPAGSYLLEIQAGAQHFTHRLLLN